MSLLVDWVSTKAHTSYLSYLVHQYTSSKKVHHCQWWRLWLIWALLRPCGPPSVNLLDLKTLSANLNIWLDVHRSWNRFYNWQRLKKWWFIKSWAGPWWISTDPPPSTPHPSSTRGPSGPDPLKVAFSFPSIPKLLETIIHNRAGKSEFWKSILKAAAQGALSRLYPPFA